MIEAEAIIQIVGIATAIVGASVSFFYSRRGQQHALIEDEDY